MGTKQREASNVRAVLTAFDNLIHDGNVYIDDIASICHLSVDAAWIAAERGGLYVWLEGYAYRVTGWKPAE